MRLTVELDEGDLDLLMRVAAVRSMGRGAPNAPAEVVRDLIRRNRAALLAEAGQRPTPVGRKGPDDHEECS